ncbi:protein cholesin isoform X6 [Phascolarctos cinereus]|uniref:Uncharacterized protein C7orf50 homolog isoform X5 n=1 Tax=Phascolarctos cinereus TaxID=38626 RepID=A0A6P5JJE8_PHACI|nr:uncharacterized protein C7orf50 homolog isoform X5 [Phascolarctos cinereus]
MPEQKKKRSEMSEKKKRKLKKLVAEEEPLAQEKPQKKKKLSAKVRAVCGIPCTVKSIQLFCISSDPLETGVSQVDAASDEEKEDEQELTPEERRTLERKLKKERKKEQKKQLREAGIHVVKEDPQKPSGAELALDYLISLEFQRVLCSSSQDGILLRLSRKKESAVLDLQKEQGKSLPHPVPQFSHLSRSSEDF